MNKMLNRFEIWAGVERDDSSSHGKSIQDPKMKERLKEVTYVETMFIDLLNFSFFLTDIVREFEDLLLLAGWTNDAVHRIEATAYQKSNWGKHSFVNACANSVGIESSLCSMR